MFNFSTSLTTSLEIACLVRSTFLCAFASSSTLKVIVFYQFFGVVKLISSFLSIAPFCPGLNNNVKLLSGYICIPMLVRS